jgi:GR25 family glycosyltransferase involved in LPS biosynthesis
MGENLTMSLNNFFDGIFCLNLDERVDRWNECNQLFQKHNIAVKRFSAIKGSKLALPWSNNVDANGYVHPPHLEGANAGGIGGNLSFMTMINTAKMLGWKSFLVFEDDVILHDNFNSLWEEISKQIPDHWDLIYFGGNHLAHMPEMLSNNIYRVFNTVCLHAIGINSTIYDKIIDQNYKINRPTDCNIADLQKNCMAIVTRPHIAWQKAGYSDVQTSVQHYGFLEKFETSIPEQFRHLYV